MVLFAAYDKLRPKDQSNKRRGIDSRSPKADVTKRLSSVVQGIFNRGAERFPEVANKLVGLAS